MLVERWRRTELRQQVDEGGADSVNATAVKHRQTLLTGQRQLLTGPMNREQKKKKPSERRLLLLLLFSLLNRQGGYFPAMTVRSVAQLAVLLDRWLVQ